MQRMQNGNATDELVLRYAAGVAASEYHVSWVKRVVPSLFAPIAGCTRSWNPTLLRGLWQSQGLSFHRHDIDESIASLVIA